MNNNGSHVNETAQSVSLQRFSHPIIHRHDFTPDIGKLYPVSAVELFPGRKVSYNVRNVMQLMPLAGDCKQDMYMYTESVFCAFHSLWRKWPLFRYGRLNPSSTTEIPDAVPFFSIYQVLTSWLLVGDTPNIPCPWLAPGSVLDSLYGICNLLKSTTTSAPGTATAEELLTQGYEWLHRPWNGLYLRAYYHHYLINHTNEWLNPMRGDMINDEYPWRDHDQISQSELIAILGLGGPDSGGEFGLPVGKSSILHERDYFTAANPEPQKGAAVTTTAGQTIQDLTKAIHQQEILEKDADAGTSHYEAIVSRYGVTPRSLGVMRPVSCAQPTRQVISINPIFNQSGDTVAPVSGGANGVNFQGDISGRGFSADGNHYVNFDADVDGCILTCCYVRQETIYDQGVHRMFSRLTRNEFFEPAMITDGDEPILNNELYMGLMARGLTYDEIPDDGEGVFGYRNKYMDYIYHPSRVSGEFHTTMEHWSMHRSFSGDTPSLNDEFVRCNDVPTRLFSYEGQPSRIGYPRFVCYMQFQGEFIDPIPNYTKREI